MFLAQHPKSGLKQHGQPVETAKLVVLQIQIP